MNSEMKNVDNQSKFGLIEVFNSRRISTGVKKQNVRTGEWNEIFAYERNNPRDYLPKIAIVLQTYKKVVVTAKRADNIGMMLRVYKMIDALLNEQYNFEGYMITQDIKIEFEYAPNEKNLLFSSSFEIEVHKDFIPPNEWFVTDVRGIQVKQGLED